LIKVTFLDYEPQTRLNISDGNEVTINYDKSDSLNNDFSGVSIQAEVDICWRWDENSTDSIDEINDPINYKRNAVIMDVPVKLALKHGDIYLHLKSVGKHKNISVRWYKIRE